MLEPGGELVDTVATGWPDDELVDVATRLRSAGAWLIAGVVISGCVGVEMSWPERTINPAGLLGTVVVFVGARKLPMDAVRGRAGISVALQIAVAVVFVTMIAQAVHATSVAAIANSLADAAAVVLVASGCTHLSRRVGADDAARWCGWPPRSPACLPRWVRCWCWCSWPAARPGVRAIGPRCR